jgi:ADP-ribose pyrophosphatase
VPKRFLDFRRHQPVKLPNGKTIKISFINHPGAVLVVPLIDKDHLVLMYQFRPALNKYIYELPAGTLDPNESLLTCAKRELIEETGYRAKKIKKIGQIYPVPGYSTEIIHIFKAEDLSAGDAQPEEYEVIKHRIISKIDVQRLFKSGKLMDAKSICALTHLNWL